LQYLQLLPVLVDTSVQHQITTLSKLVAWEALEVDDLKQHLKNVLHNPGSIFWSIRVVGSPLVQYPAAFVENVAQQAHNNTLRS
jgi:hypothetical protein